MRLFYIFLHIYIFTYYNTCWFTPKHAMHIVTWMAYMGMEDVGHISSCPLRRPASPRHARGTTAPEGMIKIYFRIVPKMNVCTTQHLKRETGENVLLRRMRQHAWQHPMSIAARYPRREWEIGQPSLCVLLCLFIKSTLAIGGLDVNRWRLHNVNDDVLLMMYTAH